MSRNSVGLAVLAWSVVGFSAIAGDVAFRRHVIEADSEFMAAAVFDVNKDGNLDIACGGFWYEGPTWKKHFLRNVEILQNRPDGYAHQPLDVNADGWTDIITVNWRTKSVKWIEHPGEKLAEGVEWKAHTVATPGNMETGRVVDLLGDGTPCVLVSTVPYWWELKRGKEPVWVQHELPKEVAGHGVGFGDVNGDGRGDVIGQNGWLEAPEDRRKGEWKWHADFELGQASIPILVVDVNGDGLNDLVWTMGHDYGVYWLAQTKADGKTKWVRHAIDTSWAGSHSPLWVDLDGDGKKELVVGRRYKAHEGRDPGEFDPQAIYRYEFVAETKTWKPQIISYDQGTCFGLDPVAIDVNGDKKLDLVFGGRNGLYYFENLGPGDSVAKKETKDPLWFPKYEDRLNLMVVKDENGETRAVKDAFDVGKRRAHTLAAVQSVIGTLPSPERRDPLNPRVTSVTQREEYAEKKIVFSESEIHSATLYLPTDVKPGSAAVICGWAEHAAALAKEGSVCLVPEISDPVLFAGHRSQMIGSVWVNVRCVDFLETLPEVNPKRIGLIGVGVDGQNGLLTAAFDCRIAAVVVGQGVGRIANYPDGRLLDWNHDRGTAFVRVSTYPWFEFSEVLAAVAPRPVYVIAPVSDKLLPAEGVKQVVESARAVYQLRGVKDSLVLVQPDVGPAIAPEQWEEAYKWLGVRLTPRPVFRPNQ